MITATGTAVSVNGDHGLTKLGQAEALLAAVESLPEARDLIASAEALRTFMKKADLGLANQNRAASIATRARRKAGEIAAMLERKLGGRPVKTREASSQVSTPLQEAACEAGVDRKSLQNWQTLAETTTDAEIEEAAAKATAEGREFTTREMLRRTPEEQAHRDGMLAGLKAIKSELEQPFCGFDLALEDALVQGRGLIGRYPDPVAAYRGVPESMRSEDRQRLVRQICQWADKLKEVL